jgi:hypothetical protein
VSFVISPTVGPLPPFPQIDYTDKDYASFRQALIDIAPTNLPEWTSRSESDFLMVLIELFAYVGDILSYYGDRVANESFLPTAQLRSSVINIVGLMDYTPAGVSAAQGIEQFTIRSGTGPVIIPAGTQVAVPASIAANQVVFETQTALTIYGASPPTLTDSFTSAGGALQGYQLRNQYSGSNAVVTVAGVNWQVVSSLDANNLLTGDAHSFESSLGGWTQGANCTIAQSTVQAYAGTHSMALTATANGTMTALSPAVPCVPGQRPMFSAPVRSNTGVSGRLFTISFIYLDINMVQVGTSTGDPGITPVNTAWTTGHTFVGSAAPVATAFVQAVVNFSCNTGETEFVDFTGLYPSATAGGPTGQVCTLTQQAGSIWKLGFGDNINGAEPTATQVITVVYQPPVTTQSYSGSVAIVQGITITGEGLGQSSGGVDQDFPLFQNPVIDGTVTVSVDEGSGPVEWLFYQHLSDALSSDPAYTLDTDANGATHVIFGDGVNGRIPVVQAEIFANYRMGGGVIGNVGANSITQQVTSIPNVSSVTNVSPTAGGAEAETLDHIRRQAPKSLKAIDRAVSPGDFAALALKVPGVAKASDSAAVYTSVTLYVHPTGGFLPTSGSPNLQSMVAALIPYITNPPTGNGYLDTRIMPGVTLTVLPPQFQGVPGYVQTNITATVGVIPTMAASVVQQAVISALSSLLSFENVDFGSRVALSSVYSAINKVAGVDYAQVQYLWRSDQSAGLGDVVCGLGEMPALGNVTISTIGGIPV